MELKEYLRIVFGYRRMILYLSLLSFAVATYGGFKKPLQYVGTTTVLMKSALLPKPGTKSFSGMGTTEQNLESKGETFGLIIRSRAVAEKVVKILELEGKDSAKKSLKPKDRHRFLLLMDDLIAIAKRIKSTLKFGKVLEKKSDPALALVQSIQATISTALIPKSAMIEITAQYSTPDMAAEIANAAANVFVDHMKGMVSAEAKVSKDFLAARVEVAKKDLEKHQDAFRKYIVAEGVSDPEGATTMVLQELVRFQSDFKKTKSKIKEVEANVAEIIQQLSKYGKTLKASTTTNVNPLVKELRSKLANMEIKRSNTSVNYGPLHPKMLTIEEEINKLNATLNGEVERIIESEVTTVNPIHRKLLSDLISKETELKVQKTKRAATSKILKEFPLELQISANKQIEWDSLVSAVKFAQDNLNSLKTKLEEARVVEAKKIGEIKIMDPAIPYYDPIGLPKIAYSFLGLIVGLMGGIGLAFFLDYLDDSVKSIETIEEELGLAVYGVIPEIKALGKKYKRKGRKKKDFEISMMEEKLITHFDPKAPIAEAYRSFRTNIQFANIQEHSKIIMITSSVKGEGKTTTTCNLGIIMAQLGNRTLLIDADLRNPTVHSLFGKRREPGLSNIMGGFSDLNKIVIPSGIENLHLITSGPIPPNPSELLSSQRLSQLLEVVKKNYDFILIDTPPIIAVTDAAILSSKVHGVFLVIHGGSTTKTLCMRAKTLLEKGSANMFGAILNNVKVESRYGYGYYYQYYYGEKKRK